MDLYIRRNWSQVINIKKIIQKPDLRLPELLSLLNFHFNAGKHREIDSTLIYILNCFNLSQ